MSDKTSAVDLTDIAPKFEDEPEPYDFSIASKGVVASDGHGFGCVMYSVGGALESALGEWGRNLEDIGFDDAPAGINIWEGHMCGSTSYEGEHDAWLEGEFREPTPEEWFDIVLGRSPLKEEKCPRHAAAQERMKKKLDLGFGR